MSSLPIPFYHYTSEHGKDGIISSKKINANPANGRHAHFGPGTYGTSLPPTQGKHAIATNNWVGWEDIYISQGKVDWAIKLMIPACYLKKPGGPYRDILLHPGPILLNKYPYELIQLRF
ncbi:hypothetical protein V1264_011492 [Littorina saxatilis]|uniref:Tox-ART-HYD1 domain-containing protein n=1 Tax=Littorina saxatilis TaxID=31220 RepID=A0AAN9BYZ9_9CAEN